MNIFWQLLKSTLTACVPRDRLIVRGPCTSSTSPTLALTFDDGPCPEHTSRLLDVLDEFHLCATFFVIGQKAEQSPELIRRIAGSGHQIANHTYTHSEPRSTSATAFLSEIERTDALLEHLTGTKPSTVRPPKGELNLAKLRGLWRSGKTVALWNVDPKDYRMTAPEQMSDWCDGYQPADGDVLLMHDNHPYASHAIRRLASNGVFDRFTTVTLDQWLGRGERSRNDRTTTEPNRCDDSKSPCLTLHH